MERLEAVPGVRKVTIFTLLARLPELGQLNRGQIAALAGGRKGAPWKKRVQAGAPPSRQVMSGVRNRIQAMARARQLKPT